MAIKKLVLENIRCFEHIDVDFSDADAPDGTRRNTFLLGQNGLGKSTILRSLALVTAGSDALKDLLFDEDSWIRRGRSSARIAATLVTAEGDERDIELTLKRGESFASMVQRNAATIERLEAALAHTSRNYFVAGYGASRRLSRSPRAGKDAYRHPRARSVATLFDPDATLHPIDSWAMDVDYKHGLTGRRMISKAFKDLLPEVDFHRIHKQKEILEFKTPDGVVPLSQLSDGYQNMVAWVGDLLYRITTTFDDFRDPLSTRGLLLIDEIDLHLHPVWQRRLVSFVADRLSNFQVVATTHAAVTAHQAGESELWIIHREDGAPRIRAFEGSPRTMMLHQLLLSDVFGLDTMDSEYVESRRTRLKELQGTRVSKAVRKEINEIRGELRELPSWTSQTPMEREMDKLVRDLKTALGERPAAKKAKRKKSTRKKAKRKAAKKKAKRSTKKKTAKKKATRKKTKKKATKKKATRKKAKKKATKKKATKKKATKKKTARKRR